MEIKSEKMTGHEGACFDYTNFQTLFVTGRWPARTIDNRLSNASCLLGISKWASPIGNLVACRSEVRHVQFNVSVSVSLLC